MFKSYQEAFDLTIEKLAAQKKRAMKPRQGYESEMVCCYSDKDNNHCAVGMHIPEGHKAHSSGQAFGGVLLEYPDLIEVFSIEGKNVLESDMFWSRIQGAHDQAKNPTILRDFLKSIAMNYGLDQDKIGLIAEWEGVSIAD